MKVLQAVGVLSSGLLSVHAQTIIKQPLSPTFDNIIVRPTTLIIKGTLAPSPPCENNVQDDGSLFVDARGSLQQSFFNNESDVDCGGNICPACTEGLKCFDDLDCIESTFCTLLQKEGEDEEGLFYSNIGLCIDPLGGREYAPFVLYTFLVTVIGYMTCFGCVGKGMLSEWWNAMKRRKKKARQGREEEERQRELEVSEALAELEEVGLEEATRQDATFKKFVPRMDELIETSRDFVGRVREDTAVKNASIDILKKERVNAVTKHRIVALGLKYAYMTHHLGAISVKDMDDMLIAMGGLSLSLTAALNEYSEGEPNKKELENISQQLVSIGSRLPAPAKDTSMVEALNKWALGEGEIRKLQNYVIGNQKALAHATITLVSTSFVSTIGLMDQVKARKKIDWKRLPRKILIFLLPDFWANHMVFYTPIFTTMAIIMLSFILATNRVDPDEITDFDGDGVDDVGAQLLRLRTAPILGRTFLPLAPYYDLTRGNQAFWIPVLYGLMHCALFMFCILPVFFARGIWRDMSRFQKFRNLVPIDDFVFVHKLFGVMCISFILAGGLIFVIVMGHDCVTNEETRACIAFDPRAPNPEDQSTFKFDPIANVFALRHIVWFTWFPILPLLHWTKNPPRWWQAPPRIRNYWYEFCYYGHQIVANTTVVLALTARFEVFYPALIGWGFYYLDCIREMTVKTYDTELMVRPIYENAEDDDIATSVIHTDSKTGMPTTVKLLIRKPPGFSMKAGQWLYFKCPGISRVQWHPFSLASASDDEFVELHVGVRGDKALWKQKKKGKEAGEWKQTHQKTFTYKLYRKVKKKIKEMAYLDDPELQEYDVEPIKVKLRGPYGSPFTKCFSPYYGGCVVIGAGTGLTAAVSVLKEYLHRKKAGKCPKFCWFVWSCQRVDDLLWCWDTLHKVLDQGVQDGIIKPGKRWNSASTMLDWLGVTIYITRADRKKLAEFTALPPELDPDRTGNVPDEFRTQLHNWLVHPRRLLTASMDDSKTHISKLLGWSRLFVDRKLGKNKQMAVCFCGPSGLAHVIHKAAGTIGGDIEFSSDSQ